MANAVELAVVAPTGFEARARTDEPLPAPTGDCAVVEAARRGDRAAFAELYLRYARMVHGLLLASVPRTDVDDLVQDVFLVAMRRLDSLREAAAFPGWLAAIARHRAADYYRRHAPDHLPLAADVPATASDNGEARATESKRRFVPSSCSRTCSISCAMSSITSVVLYRRTAATRWPPANDRTSVTARTRLVRSGTSSMVTRTSWRPAIVEYVSRKVGERESIVATQGWSGKPTRILLATLLATNPPG